MDALSYAPVPHYAALLEEERAQEIRVEEPSRPLPPSPDWKKRRFSLDSFTSGVKPPRAADIPPASSSFSSNFSIPNILISSAISLPNTPAGTFPRGPPHALLSTRDPLALQITTANFRRFISRVGFVFWLEDRAEEVVMWRKGWKYTSLWIISYSLLCYNPQFIILLPHIAILFIMFSTYHSPPKSTFLSSSSHTSIADPSISASFQPPGPSPASEGSTAWLANIQAIQNLMGFVSDAYDLVIPVVPHLTWQTRTSIPLFLVLLFSAAPMMLLPLRMILFVAGVTPLIILHPWIRVLLFDPNGPLQQSQLLPTANEKFRNLINEAYLSETHINAKELRQIEIFQNERWVKSSASHIISNSDGTVSITGWKNSTTNLKPTERRAWTRGKDGSIGVGDSNTHLTVPLEPGWAFVETEDWQPDFLGSWARGGADRDGWVYTNDAWLDPRPAPLEEWAKQGYGITRRRRWTRRVYRM